MGMIINGQWCHTSDKDFEAGDFARRAVKFKDPIPMAVIQRLKTAPSDFVIIASKSCPWSHRVILALTLKQLTDHIPVHVAGGSRVEGYGLLPVGPLTPTHGVGPRHVHEIYTATDPHFTGRATVPLLVDIRHNQIISNESDQIAKALDQISDTPSLYPTPKQSEIEGFNQVLYENLGNAVYKAGLAREQAAYETAVSSIFDTLQLLEVMLGKRTYVHGERLTLSDAYLFAILVRFDAVYYTHFRCCYKRLIEYPNLWAYARRIYMLPGISKTVDFDVIREGYYLNDGDHNPYKIVGRLPHAHWNVS